MTDTTDIKALRERMMQQREAALTGNAPSFEDCELLACDLLRALTISNKQLEAERQRADDADARIFVLEKGEKYWFEEFKKAVVELAVLEGDQVPVEYQMYYHNHGTGGGEWCRVRTRARYEELQREHAGDNDFSFRTLFTATQKPVVLPHGYKPYLVRSQTTATRAAMTSGGEWLHRDEVTAAVEAAGGKVAE